MSQATPPSKHGRPAQAWPLTLAAAMSLADLAALFAWIVRSRALASEDLRIPMLVSISASAAILLLSHVFPALLPHGRTPPSLALTLPALHASLKALVAALASTGGTAIQRVPDALVPVSLWLEPLPLLLCAAFQCALLGLLIAGQRHFGSR